ncbi:MAG: hypothetical protein EBU19_06310, partial [Gammaproteobacteria bacterium]|nr:hypothetical protein [Gammaproteobacteria bacterium]
NVRTIGFDFGFTPKSMSKMVPEENSYRSDKALGQLIEEFPNRVVLGCLFSGVQTPYLKPLGTDANPPLFSDVYVFDSTDFRYPEASSYPIINFMDNQFIGRMGSFSFLPYNKSDDVKRWSTLWYPSGGKSHAYNLLGGKQRFLKLELSLQKKELIEALNKSQLELDELNPVITNFQHRLEEQRDNPIMRPLIEAQIESRVEDRNLLFNTISEIERRIAFLERLNSSAETEIVEANKSLQLVYSNSGEGFMKGQLVDTLPNSVPLERDEPIFTLAVETLLAYYGISSEQVEVSNDSLKIFSLDGDLLINAPMSDGQWLEVNYFSRWKESKEIETLLREARE